VQGNRGIPGHVDYILPRRKPGPPGKEEVRAALVEEHRRTGASARSLARKYGVSSGTAWRRVYGKSTRYQGQGRVISTVTWGFSIHIY
jgi:transposase-like protein